MPTSKSRARAKVAIVCCVVAILAYIYVLEEYSPHYPQLSPRKKTPVPTFALSQRSTLFFILAVLPPVLTARWVVGRGGLSLLRLTQPIGLAVALCILTRCLTARMPSPINCYQPGSAMITVIFMMETGVTLERILIRVTLRTIGTLIGAVASIAGALLITLLGHDPLVAASFSCAVFVICAVLAKEKAATSYIWTVVQVTYSLVFFGFVLKGWDFLWGRMISVFVGEIISVLSNLFMNSVCNDIRQSLSQVHIVLATGQIIDKALVSVDFVCLRGEVSTLPEGKQLSEESVGPVSTRGDYEYYNLKVENTNIEALRDQIEAQPFGQKLASDESALTVKCSACWADIQMMRWFLRSSCLDLLFGRSELDYNVLPQKAHLVFMRSAALVHVEPMDGQDWKGASMHLQKLREEFQTLGHPLRQLFNGFPTQQAQDESIVPLLQAVATGLVSSQRLLGLVWQDWKAAAVAGLKEDLLNGEGDAVPSVRQIPQQLRCGSRRAAFCYNLELVISELAEFVSLYTSVLQVPPKHAEAICKPLSRLMIPTDGFKPRRRFASRGVSGIDSGVGLLRQDSLV
eukprot:TRINITY_DN22539_c0_g1_i1.p1 TRINITY_DN22539_c0_g1~~TRINITY_DN22539_c0_g1_i1.p1  ORF type:complete len:573 (-),score=112.83 TRINITY_DN22539_c0_g1_i1:116-1834(-)